MPITSSYTWNMIFMLTFVGTYTFNSKKNAGGDEYAMLSKLVILWMDTSSSEHNTMPFAPVQRGFLVPLTKL